MQMPSLRRQMFGFLTAIALLAFSGMASADPPLRVARLGYTSGSVSFSPDGQSEWIEASLNRPLTTGDRLWAGLDARAEVQIDAVMLRVDANSAFSILNLDDQIAQLELTQGTLKLRVRSLAADQLVEVDTPNLAFVVRQAGEYRIEVAPDGDATTVVVRQGQAEVHSDDLTYVIDPRQPYRFTGTSLRDYQYVDVPRFDEFDRWASDRDNTFDHSESARFVSPQVVGYQDLDAHGSWQVNTSYGHVWFPNRVRLGWSPFYDGHWVWINPWGWTWVDDAPWGFTVSHYGRWINVNGAWGWVPGPVRSRAYYSPALVMFLGGDNKRLMLANDNVSDVAWFPLAPREVYRPPYQVSRSYFLNVNTSNTVINNTVVNNNYNVSNASGVVYANRGVPGAVVAVPHTVFEQSRRVSSVGIHVPHDVVANAQLAASAPMAPSDRSVRGVSHAESRPPARVFERPVVYRSTPPASHVGFAVTPLPLTTKMGEMRAQVDSQSEHHAPSTSVPLQHVGGEHRVHPAMLTPPPPMQRAIELPIVPAPVKAPIALPQGVAPAAPTVKSGEVAQPPAAQTSAARHKPAQSVPAGLAVQTEPRPPGMAPVKSPQGQVVPTEHAPLEPKIAASKPKRQKPDAEEARRTEENRK